MIPAPRYVEFAGVDAPLRLEGCSEIVGTLRAIVPGWPVQLREGAPAAEPFFEIRPGAEPGRYECRNRRGAARPRQLDAVNAVCDVVAALSSEPSFLAGNVLCLHTAAIEINGRLVLVPNARRAGKSTLSVCLARLGHRVFTDDFLRVARGEGGVLVGRANGVCPRIRLPLPPPLEPALSEWSADLDSVENAQYCYLAVEGLARNGETAPIGAVVFLERAEDGPARCAPVSPEDAISALLFQNFGRHIHSGATLSALHFITEALPVLRLDYSDAMEAARLLDRTFAEWTSPLPPFGAAGELPPPPEEFRPAAFQPGLRYARVSGATVRKAREVTFLADPEGHAIHRLDALSEAVWSLLEHPMSDRDVREVLQAAFPGVPEDRIADDTGRLMTWLCAKGLIEPSRA